MRLKLTLLALLVCSCFKSFAQDRKNVAEVKGRVILQPDRVPVSGATVTISALRQIATTDQDGNFQFLNLPFGTYRLSISGEGLASDTVRFMANKEVVNLGNITVESYHAALVDEHYDVPTIFLEDNSMDDGEDGLVGQNVSGLLTAGRDPFLNTASFVWGSYWFRLRGNRQDQQDVLINGAPMNDIETDRVFWSQWGGLNDVFKGRTSSYGLQAFDYGYGGGNGGIYLDATASGQRKQTKFTYSLSNRQYRHRLMLTHSSGPLKGGWAYSLSFSRRLAKEGYVPGTFYGGYSFFAAASKRIKQKHKINLTAFGAPTTKGRSIATYQEAYDLAGASYYNPAWGYQSGEKRNARIVQTFQPVILLNHEYAPSSGTRWNTVIGYQFGKNSSSTIDWYQAPDPRPDYYRYLPAYYLLQDPPDSQRAASYATAFKADPQIRWDEIYQANYANRQPAPWSTSSGDSARRSLYVLGNDVDDLRKWMLNSTLQHAVNDRLNVFGGLSYTTQTTESYRELEDLLGGDYFLNINSFAERIASGGAITTYSQYDLHNPDKVVREGDRYYYNYLMSVTKAAGWAQATYTMPHFDFFLAGEAGYTSFQREGLYRNGLYASGNGSFGKSAKQAFTTWGVKGGATWKIDGRNYLLLNAGYSTSPPAVENTFFAARVRNATVVDPHAQTISSAEGGYLRRAPKTNIRAIGYVSDVKDQVQIQRFYYQGAGSANTFVNYVMQHLNTRSVGAELGISQQLHSSITISAVAALGQSFFTNNPDVSIYQENTPDTLPKKENVFIKNYYQGVGPQSAYSLGLNYRSKKYWYGTLTANYLDRNYIGIAAPRRNEHAVELITPGSPRWHAILDQERFSAAFTIDLFLGKSFLLSKYSKRLPRGLFLSVNLAINNLLDNKEVLTTGYENARVDYEGGDTNRFANKYLYALGRNYFLNLALKF